MSDDMMDQRDLIHYGLEQELRYAEQRYEEMDREYREYQLEQLSKPLPEGYDWGDRLLTDEEREIKCLENLIEEVSARVEELYDDCLLYTSDAADERSS